MAIYDPSSNQHSDGRDAEARYLPYKNKSGWEYFSQDSIIYQGENDETPYTKKDLIDLCKGNENTARTLYEHLEWQSPSTLLTEWFGEGEIDEDCNFITHEAIPENLVPGFTPGPWQVEYCLDQSAFINAGDSPVAMIQSEDDEGLTPTIEANARLMAAAPDMYAFIAKIEAYFWEQAPEVNEEGSSAYEFNKEAKELLDRIHKN